MPGCARGAQEGGEGSSRDVGPVAFSGLRAASVDADTRRRTADPRGYTALARELAGTGTPLCSGPRPYRRTMRIAVLGPLEVLSDDGRAGGGAGRQGTAAPGRAGGRRPGRRQHRPHSWSRSGTATRRRRPASRCRRISSRLRSSLEPDRPKGSTGRYVVRRGRAMPWPWTARTSTRCAFGDLAARGRARLAAGDAAEAVRRARRALDLWRGEPYADWPDAAVRRRGAPPADRGPGGRRRPGSLEAQLALGRHAEVLPELERLVAEEPLREDWWRLLMLALYRAGRQADALAAGRRVRALLAEELGVDPGPALRAHGSGDPGPGPGAGAPRRRRPVRVRRAGRRPPTRPCPYKGLAAYQAADARCSTGGSGWSPVWSARLVDAPSLVVSGPSGAGKSSVVRAGLLPALAAGALPGARTWTPVIVTPGPAPVDALAELTGESPPARPVVLVCDQSRSCGHPGWTPRERDRLPRRGPRAARRRGRRALRRGRPRRPRRPTGRARRLHRAARVGASSSSRRSPTPSCARSCANRPRRSG